jgi:hypothetical protein
VEREVCQQQRLQQALLQGLQLWLLASCHAWLAQQLQVLLLLLAQGKRQQQQRGPLDVAAQQQQQVKAAVAAAPALLAPLLLLPPLSFSACLGAWEQRQLLLLLLG